MANKQVDSEQLMALIDQNRDLLRYLVAKEIGHANSGAEWQEKANEVLMDLVTKAPASNMTAQRLHGLGGLFSTPGLDRDVISTHVRSSGIGEVLPLFPTVEEDPRFGALTGVSDDIGSEPAAPCDNAPTGYIKACNLTAQFGRIARDTETIDYDEVGLKVNRGDFTDLMLHGFRLGGEVNSGMYPSGLNPGDILNIVTASQMVSVGERIYRKLMVQNWQGSPANNNAGGGYKEYPGLDNQITTGQIDADSGTACPSLDSDVKNFNSVAVTTGTGNNIMSYISAMEYYLYSLAEDTGMLPVRWVIAMRPQLFYELSAVWPIVYNTDKVAAILGSTAGNANVVLDGRDMVAERDAMRNGKYLIVNGRRYEVVTDPGIFEANNTNTAGITAGSYASSIYFIPITVNGNFPVTYRQHKNYRAMWAGELPLMRNRNRFWTDDGVFSWAFEDQKWCLKLSAKTEQRIVLRAPHLAGRIDNVMYSPLQHIREGDPDSPYYTNGGVSLRANQAKSAVWL